jgi:hypothetical protein
LGAALVLRDIFHQAQNLLDVLFISCPRA